MGINKKQIRENFRNKVFSRDHNKCVFCDVTTNLDAHHITDRNDMPNGGYILENGITVCSDHHILCEKFHISGGLECEPGFHPNDLYTKIKSSKELVIKLDLKNGK